MTQYSNLIVKLSNSKFNNLKSGIKNGAEKNGDEANFRHKLLLTDRQVS